MRAAAKKGCFRRGAGVSSTCTEAATRDASMREDMEMNS
jgi:hypothetical protein